MAYIAIWLRRCSWHGLNGKLPQKPAPHAAHSCASVFSVLTCCASWLELPVTLPLPFTTLPLLVYGRKCWCLLCSAGGRAVEGGSTVLCLSAFCILYCGEVPLHASTCMLPFSYELLEACFHGSAEAAVPERLLHALLFCPLATEEEREKSSRERNSKLERSVCGVFCGFNVKRRLQREEMKLEAWLCLAEDYSLFSLFPKPGEENVSTRETVCTAWKKYQY